MPQTSDEFYGAMSLAWQWHANPQDDWMSSQVPVVLMPLISFIVSITPITASLRLVWAAQYNRG